MKLVRFSLRSISLEAVMRMLALTLTLSLTLACASAPAPQSASAPHRNRAPETLYANLWMQIGAEYRALAHQTYQTAARNLDDAMKDPTWSAAPEQQTPFASLPPAIIFDIDETIIEHTPFQSRVILYDRPFTEPAWQKWLAEGKARAIPGSVEFTRLAASRGVKIFYISNVLYEKEMRANLVRLGFPVDESMDTVLIRGEREEWKGRDKGARRRDVTSRYRVLMMFGDDLGDFLSGVEAPPADRFAMVDKYESYWGERWFMLPNPTYGSWERTLAPSGATREQQLEIKYKALDPDE